MALVLAVAIPLAGVMAYVSYKAVQESSAAATELLRLATARVVGDLRRTYQQSEWMLGQLATEPEVRGMSATACGDEARLLRRLHPEFINLIIWNRAGKIVCSSTIVPPGAVPVGNTTAAFRRSLETNTFQASDVFFGQIGKSHLLLFIYPIANDAGAVVGLLSAGLSLRHFDQMLKGLDLPPGSAIAVLDRNLAYVARAPEGDKWRGMSAKHLSLEEVPAVGARTAELVQGADGVQRLYVSELMPETGWKIFAGIPRQYLLSRHRAWLLWAVGLTLFMVAIGTAAAYAIAARLSRQFRRMLRGEQELMARLLRAEEQERARISRELHDQVGQDLTALALDLRLMRRHGTSQALDRAAATAARLIDQVGDVSLALRPPQLDDLGLASALRGHVERHVRPHGINVHFDIDVEPRRFSTEMETACFRVAQEALTNILRHAEAGNVWIHLGEVGGDLVLIVRDDGRGFDVDAALEASADSRSLGLRNLFDRTQLLGGRLEIRSSPGGGTEVRAAFPV